MLCTVFCSLPHMIAHMIHIYSSVSIQLSSRRKLCPFLQYLGKRWNYLTLMSSLYFPPGEKNNNFENTFLLFRVGKFVGVLGSVKANICHGRSTLIQPVTLNSAGLRMKLLHWFTCRILPAELIGPSMVTILEIIHFIQIASSPSFNAIAVLCSALGLKRNLSHQVIE